MKIDLSEKTVLLTGGLGAISRYIVNALIDAGAFVILTDRLDEEKARELMQERGHAPERCTYRTMDVTKPEDSMSVVNALFEIYPDINIVLGHAGGTAVEKFEDTTVESFDKVLDFNFRGQVYLTRPVLKQWVERRTKGHVIYTSSFVSKIPWKGISAYCAAKAGLDMFAKTLALEYAPHGIRFNVISPGNVAAGSSKLIYENDPEYRKAVDQISPLGMRNSPEAIANGFLYLCSHLGDELDGHNLTIDAGVALPVLQQ